MALKASNQTRQIDAPACIGVNWQFFCTWECEYRCKNVLMFRLHSPECHRRPTLAIFQSQYLPSHSHSPPVLISCFTKRTSISHLSIFSSLISCLSFLAYLSHFCVCLYHLRFDLDLSWFFLLCEELWCDSGCEVEEVGVMRWVVRWFFAWYVRWSVFVVWIVSTYCCAMLALLRSWATCRHPTTTTRNRRRSAVL